jgi:hypothetical protein
MKRAKRYYLRDMEKTSLWKGKAVARGLIRLRKTGRMPEEKTNQDSLVKEMKGRSRKAFQAHFIHIFILDPLSSHVYGVEERRSDISVLV